MFKVVLSPHASAFYSKVDRILAGKLARCFRQLEHDPRRHNQITRLVGKLKGKYRYRIGDYRVIYAIDNGTATVNVLDIGPRASIYD